MCARCWPCEHTGYISNYQIMLLSAPVPDTRCPQFSASDARVEGRFWFLKKRPSNADAGVMRGCKTGGCKTQRTLFSINPTRLTCYICIVWAAWNFNMERMGGLYKKLAIWARSMLCLLPVQFMQRYGIVRHTLHTPSVSQSSLLRHVTCCLPHL